MGIEFRKLEKSDLHQIWQIDRREVIDAIYSYENGKLVLKSEHYDMHGWPADEEKIYGPILEKCFDHGGIFWGVFDGETMAGVAVLDNKLLRRAQDTLQLKFLHVSYLWRGTGLGKKLFAIAAQEARKMGAKWMYISATPSKHTVDFYTRQGCVIAQETDPELFALEPEDIHLNLHLGQI